MKVLKIRTNNISMTRWIRKNLFDLISSSAIPVSWRQNFLLKNEEFP